MAGSSSDAHVLENLRIFASYSPAEVVLRYASMENPQPPQQPEQQDFDAAIGFVDVSGFTALSERLQKDFGRAGAEKLNQCVPHPSSRLAPPRRRRCALISLWRRTPAPCACAR